MTALVNPASLPHSEPAVYIIQDAQWIDEVSESMLADFVAVIPRTPSLVLITCRPEYRGVLTKVSGAQTIALRELSDAHTAALTGKLLGSDASSTGWPRRSPPAPPATRISSRRWCAIWPSAGACSPSGGHAASLARLRS